MCKVVAVLCLVSPVWAQISPDRDFTSMAMTYNVAAFGILPDGNDCSEAVNALIEQVMQNGGGTIEFNTGAYRLDFPLILPSTDVSLQSFNAWQPPLRLTGQGGSFWGFRTSDVSGGTVLLLRSNIGLGKIVTRASGFLGIDNLAMKSEAPPTNPTPFIYTIMTTVHVTNVGFWGHRQNPHCDEDAIVLGGTNQNEGYVMDDCPFQGYGTVIEKCFFDCVQRWVYGRTFANALMIQNNTGTTRCSGLAAIQFENVNYPRTADAGACISGNLFEMYGYQYGIHLKGALSFNLIGNSFYDPSGVTKACYRLDEGSDFTVIVDGYVGNIKSVDQWDVAQNKPKYIHLTGYLACRFNDVCIAGETYQNRGAKVQTVGTGALYQNDVTGAERSIVRMVSSAGPLNSTWIGDGANGRTRLFGGDGTSASPIPIAEFLRYGSYSMTYLRGQHIIDPETSLVIGFSNDKLGFFGNAPISQPSKLTPSKTQTVNSGDPSTDEVIENLRTRVNELESKLSALGLVAK